ncbi:MAG: CAP domain-containing protein [Pseudomonadota bacterium]
MIYPSDRIALFAAAAILSAIASGSSSAPASPDLGGRIVAVHNAERVRVGAVPLAWDPVLAAGAAQYAAQIASSGNFVHSDRAARPGIGENLWAGTRGYYAVESAVGGWLGEKRYFVPGIFPNNSSDGNWMSVSHYTQMIWPTTTRIGCAWASGRSSDYLVCRYSPKGNINGRTLGFIRAERG